MECILLQTEPIGESDLFVTALTTDGRRIEGIAKSARAISSKRHAGLQQFSVSDVTFAPGRHQWIVRSAAPMLTFSAFRTSFVALAALSVLAGLVSSSATERPDPNLYAAFTRFLRDFHTAVLSREPAQLLARRFAGAFVRHLALLGFSPRFDRCAKCGTKESLSSLSPSSGGIVCGPCASMLSDSRSLSQSGIEALAARRIPQAQSDVSELFRFLSAFASWHLPSIPDVVPWGLRVFSTKHLPTLPVRPV